MKTRWFYKFPGNPYGYGPTTSLYGTKKAARDAIKKSWGLDRWPAGAEIWRAT